MSTIAEREWMDQITQIGCVVCLLFHSAPGTPGCPHHLLDEGGRRIGHLNTICLCDPGHHQNAPKASGKVSRHPNKAIFENTYGSEESLLDKMRELVRQRFGVRVARGPRMDGVDIDRVHYKLGAVRKQA